MNIQSIRAARSSIGILMFATLTCGIVACEKSTIGGVENDDRIEKYVAGYKELSEPQKREVREIFWKDPVYIDKEGKSWMPYAHIFKKGEFKLDQLRDGRNAIPMMYIDPDHRDSDQRYAEAFKKLDMKVEPSIMPSIVGLTREQHKDNPFGSILGSGFCVGNQLVVSAAHVLYGNNYSNAKSRQLQMQYVILPRISEIKGVSKGAYARFEPFEIDPNTIHVVPNHDLVVFGVRPVKTQEGSQVFLDDTRCPPMEYESDSNNDKLDDRVTLVGFPQRNWTNVLVVRNALRLRGNHPTAARDGVNCAVKMLATSFQGMSGGPIVSERTKRVIGVFTWQRYSYENENYPATDDNAACGESIFPLVNVINAQIARNNMSPR